MLDHALTIHGDYYLPTDKTGIPSGEWRDVTGSNFDFRQSKLIGRDFLQDNDQVAAGGYDHTFVLDSACIDGRKAVASLSAPEGDVK